MDQGIEAQAVPSVVAGRARGGRAEQQDACICLHDPATDVRLLVLADGMGGDGAGELASAGVIEVTRRLWGQGLWREQPGPLFLETLCQSAHAELRRRGEGLVGAEPHSTVVALLLRGRRACWAHVGDSRLYRFQGGRCLGRTEDHSVAQLKVARGELAAEAMGGDADQHMLLRGLGGPQPPQVEHGFAALRPGQSFALCSDGVWERLSTDELGRLARRRDLRRAMREALAQAVERGGADGDNVSLIFARIGWVQWWHARSARLWARLAGRGMTRAGDVGMRQV
ncbi:MAG TPA: protein phosphatase 2C domain-containing protein [Frateuria sp.]|uniref:PP2C family protein-serine/threonine phosphatase n=1 Tax=Frateuria sp. TaxID=2211372 RepID=UPI002D80146E|nr:protein phosphatase 2C domain-containing protein [Frateuria sp.]HET6806707.1 protein phosphatase 2C domain-containing protein [Frateuria sp.]